MTDKFAEFLKITSQLNKMGIVPLLMGSLGLEQVTGQDCQARDIETARRYVTTQLGSSMADFSITGLNETQIIDIFEHE